MTENKVPIIRVRNACLGCYASYKEAGRTTSSQEEAMYIIDRNAARREALAALGECPINEEVKFDLAKRCLNCDFSVAGLNKYLEIII